MASIWRKTMVYLGLVDDDEYEEYEPYDEPQPQAPQPAHAPMMRRSGRGPEPVEASMGYEPESTGGVRTLPREETAVIGGGSAVTVQQRPSVVRPFTQPQNAKVHVVVPVGFNDAQEIGDKLKDSQPVIVNLQGVDRDLSRRLIDFSSGLTYGIGGQMERVAEQVFLLTPSNVEVSPEEKRRLQERGLYRS